MEQADEVSPLAIDWIRRNGKAENWFLHVNFWDPHTPYRAPREFGDPFKDTPLPTWYTEEVRREHWSRPGPHSAQEMRGWDDLAGSEERRLYSERQPFVADSMDKVRMMFDGYDTG